MNSFLSWIIDRLGENSTWRGMIAIATAAGVKLDEQHAASIIAAGLALIGLINVFRKAPVTTTTPPKP